MSIQPIKPKKFRDPKTSKEKSDKTRKNQLIGGAIMMIIALAFVLVYTLSPDYKIDEINNQYGAVIKYSNEGAVINYTDEEGLHYDKWFDRNLIPVFDWLNESTPTDAVILTWWDYGHGIKGYAERESIIKNPSADILYSVANPELITEFDSHEIIEDVALAFSTQDENNLYEIMNNYSSEYIFIGGYDIFKASTMYNVTGLNPTDYIVQNSDDSLEFTTLGKSSIMGKLYLNVNSPLELVYEDGFARIYQKV